MRNHFINLGFWKLNLEFDKFFAEDMEVLGW